MSASSHDHGARMDRRKRHLPYSIKVISREMGRREEKLSPTSFTKCFENTDSHAYLATKSNCRHAVVMYSAMQQNMDNLLLLGF